MFQTLRNERILKFISSTWQRFECLGAAQSVCHWRVAFVRQQIVQTRRFTQDAAPEKPESPCYTIRGAFKKFVDWYRWTLRMLLILCHWVVPSSTTILHNSVLGYNWAIESVLLFFVARLSRHGEPRCASCNEVFVFKRNDAVQIF